MLGLVLLLAPAIAFTQQTAEVDPPARVGRLAIAAGDVQSWNARDATWQDAVPNLPVTSGSAFATGFGARAEVQVGESALRLDADTRVDFERLDDQASVLRLVHGNVVLRIRPPLANGEPEQAWNAQVGALRFTLSAPGAYRLEYDDRAGRVGVAVIRGEARVDGGIAPVLLERDYTTLDASSGRPIAQSAIPKTVFSAWSDLRDQVGDAPEAYQHVSPAMTGAQDLDQWGQWEAHVDYGPIWFPRVQIGWVPYRDGRWVWVAPWGWTWVDAAPWGFAPFHYGRWVRVRNAWAWVPGRYVRRPVYAPAIVGFYGSDGAVSFSLSFAAGVGLQWGLSIGNAPVAGWFPLAPGEPWRPAYRASPRYVRNVNISHVTNVVVIDRDHDRNRDRDRDLRAPEQRFRYAHDHRVSTLATRAAIERSQAIAERRLLPERRIGPAPARPLAPERRAEPPEPRLSRPAPERRVVPPEARLPRPAPERRVVPPEPRLPRPARERRADPPEPRLPRPAPERRADPPEPRLPRPAPERRADPPEPRLPRPAPERRAEPPEPRLPRAAPERRVVPPEPRLPRPAPERRAEPPEPRLPRAVPERRAEPFDSPEPAQRGVRPLPERAPEPRMQRPERERRVEPPRSRRPDAEAAVSQAAERAPRRSGFEARSERRGFEPRDRAPDGVEEQRRSERDRSWR